MELVDAVRGCPALLTVAVPVAVTDLEVQDEQWGGSAYWTISLYPAFQELRLPQLEGVLRMMGRESQSLKERESSSMSEEIRSS